MGLLLLAMVIDICPATAAAPIPLPVASGLNLKLQLSSDRRSARVTVPATVKLVSVERFSFGRGWQNVAKTAAVAGTMQFSLPASPKGTKWRAIGWSNGTPVAVRDKFPTKFYQGSNKFSPVRTSAAWPMMIDTAFLPMATSVVSNDKGAVATLSAEPVEADIWKVEGNTVYFFNQLRGLQILDLSNPADPRLTASLRLPALGQDLYLLPATDADRTLVLLTEGWTNGKGQWTRINMVKVAGGKIEITHSQEVIGNLADSRMVGNRLVLATNEWNYQVANGSSQSRLSEWLIAPDTAPSAAGETLIPGSNPVIAAGADWLAIAIQPVNQWSVSEVSVFAVRPTGLVRLADPIRTEGRVEGKFGMNWSNNVLTTISEQSWHDGRWSPVTVLENFRAWAPEVIRPAVVEPSPLGRLELAHGEGLFATRFAGNKAYAVTFLRTDPLWVLDLSDATKPIISGHLEVPGWSTYLQPIGDMLFSIGFESGSVAASLFDVANPAAPSLLRRINIGVEGNYSEATWNEKALRVLPEAGLAMIPLGSYNFGGEASASSVQLLDIDLAARDLRLRGKITQAFNPRRADLIGDKVVAISQRVLTTADISDRDAPAVISEVSLAWPVDRAVPAGNYLLQIEDSGSATLRISPATAPESILAEIPLGLGTVRDADLRNGKLTILRETSPNSWGYFWRYSSGAVLGENRLALDIYDASALPALPLLGTCSVPLESGERVSGDGLLWPQSNRPAVLVNTESFYAYGWGRPMVIIDAPLISTPQPSSISLNTSNMGMISPYYYNYNILPKSPKLALFDITVATAPLASPLLPLGPDGLQTSGVAAAADGLVVFGLEQTKSITNPKNEMTTERGQVACVVEVLGSHSPVIRPLIDLPGSLFAITDLDSKGFLAFTRKAGAGSTTDLEVSASDGFDAFFVTGINEAAYPTATAAGRRLFVSRPTGVQIFQLTNEGKLLPQSLIAVGWQPYSLRWTQNTLVGGQSNSIFAANADGGGLKTWDFATWSPGLDRSAFDDSGALIVPFGQYGVERLER